MLVAVLWLPGVCGAQGYTYKGPSTYPAAAPAPAPYGTTRPAAPAPTPMKIEEVEALVAPLALYPDSLLAQILMASTYPLEVVQAERWVKANPSLKDNAAELNKLTWDPSVKSLLDFPQVLTMMSEKLDWTVKLGDAFIADQKVVMDAVQKLRGKAYSQGNLKDSNEQKVKVEVTAATATQPSAQVIVVESAQPNVVYVPSYNPTVVYGGWPYPAYPPVYYPPSYVAGTALVSFGVGMAVGAAWGHAWGGCNWGHSEVDVDINRNTNFNSNIDREAFRSEQNERQTNRQGNQDARQGSRDSRQGNRQAGGGAGVPGLAVQAPSSTIHRTGRGWRIEMPEQRRNFAGRGRASRCRRRGNRTADAPKRDVPPPTATAGDS